MYVFMWRFSRTNHFQIIVFTLILHDNNLSKKKKKGSKVNSNYRSIVPTNAKDPSQFVTTRVSRFTNIVARKVHDDSLSKRFTILSSDSSPHEFSLRDKFLTTETQVPPLLAWRTDPVLGATTSFVEDHPLVPLKYL